MYCYNSSQRKNYSLVSNPKLPLSSQPTSSRRRVHALRHTTGMMRMYRVTIGGSNRFVLVPSLSLFPINTSRNVRDVNTRLNHRKSQSNRKTLFFYDTHLVFPLTSRSEHHVHFPIKAGCHLEGLDKLRRAHTTGSLCDDASQSHFLL